VTRKKLGTLKNVKKITKSASTTAVFAAETVQVGVFAYEHLDSSFLLKNRSIKKPAVRCLKGRRFFSKAAFTPTLQKLEGFIVKASRVKL
jgi:hypothetical protein